MMYDTYIVKRTQIYLDERQTEKLTKRAAARGTTASRIIREAIDEYLAEPDSEDVRLARFRAAVDAAFGTAPHLPDGARYVDEVRRPDTVREAELRRRRRA